jgi:hypothetical protein
MSKAYNEEEAGLQVFVMLDAALVYLSGHIFGNNIRSLKCRDLHVVENFLIRIVGI